MNFKKLKKHILNRIVHTEINKFPFYNMYVENIFPDEFYLSLKYKILEYKYNKELEDRNWDNPNFINKKLSLKNYDDDEISLFRKVFDDSEIKNSIMSKFYHNFSIGEIVFNHDLQLVFTGKDRFQKIHTDIPAQFVSVVFYIPEDELTDQEKIDNATILYDKELNPHKLSKFSDNTVSFFAPHFYSYHGFNTTIENRNTLLFFYAQKDLIKRFYDNIHNENGEQNPDKFKDVIQWKISKWRLLEYGLDDGEFLTKIIEEKSNCKIDSLNGRINQESRD